MWGLASGRVRSKLFPNGIPVAAGIEGFFELRDCILKAKEVES